MTSSGESTSDTADRNATVASGIYKASPTGVPLQQGEVLSQLKQEFLNFERMRQGELAVDDITHKFAIVVSQSCDLEWDLEERKPGGEPDKLLPYIILCETFTAEEVRSRKNAQGQPLMVSKLWDPLKKNKDERFHFFEAVPNHEDAEGEGLPELVVDFKRYFSVATPELYWKLTQTAKRRTQLLNPYLEHFASRFFQYQSRVATPRQHKSV